MTECQTFYSDKHYLSKTNKIYLVAANSIISCSNIFLNSVLIYAILKSQTVLNTSYKLILFLTISDLFVGVLTQPLFTVVLLTDHQKATCACGIAAQCIGYSTCQFSGLIICIISLDRYMHMRYLNRYNIYMNNKVAKRLVGSAIVIVVCLMLSSIFVALYRGFYEFHTVVLAVETVLMISVSVLYTSTYLSVRNQVQPLRIRSNLFDKKEGEIKLIRCNRSGPHNLNLAKTLVFILLAGTVCYLPFIIVGFIHTYIKYIQDREPRELLHALRFWSYLFVILNSSCNAVIFITSNTNIRRHIYKIICGGRDETNNVKSVAPSSNDANTFRKD